MRHLFFVGLLAMAMPASAQVSKASQASCHLEGPELIAAFTEYMKATPSKDEMAALLNKANQKVSDFEKIVTTLSVSLDQAASGTVKQNLDGAANAHTVIATLTTKGISNQGLVGLLSILDDLSRSASRDSLSLLVNTGATSDTVTAVTALSSAGNALYDISELVFHATFRAIGASDGLISQLVDLIK